jgi:hypothetical protein
MVTLSPLLLIHVSWTIDVLDCCLLGSLNKHFIIPVCRLTVHMVLLLCYTNKCFGNYGLASVIGFLYFFFEKETEILLKHLGDLCLGAMLAVGKS